MRLKSCITCTYIIQICMFTVFIRANNLLSKSNLQLAKTFKRFSSRLLTMSTSTTESDPSVILNNYNIVKSKIQSISSHRPVKLVAVSKTKPASDIMVLYNEGHRDFGENYFQELEEKAELLPNDINWHFIGHLQSSKASKLIKSVPNLSVIETVDSLKLALKLNNACESIDRDSLNIFLQVDTSNEDTKSGVDIDEMVPLAQSILLECPRLRIKGLMTIGAPGDLSCFDKLSSTREILANTLGIDKNELELSMGMSADYEEAIHRGATSVRVGSTIFGPRIYSSK